ncbi:MAG TPA: GGDEF domain-containing protein [Solirubrobacteraceae bacterium]|nr:GGDEF domain-containing protein [Solirubrobacteraceae bacterium]
MKTWDPEPGARPVLLRVALIALLTAAAVALDGVGEAYWLCVPAVLAVCAWARSRVGAILAAATVVVAASAAAVIAPHARPLPSPLLALAVPAASAAVLIAVRERLERERDAMEHFALSDPLTGIANRRSLLAQIEYEIARHARAQRSFALLMLDLDGFKELNDRFGHAAGDDLLKDVAGAMKRSIRRQDTAARVGGDEFCVLAPETDPAGARQLAARIAQAVGEVTAGVEALRASGGIALYPDDGVAADALLHEADQRLLKTKRERRRGRSHRRAA